MIDGSPIDFYELLVSEEILRKIVIETNRYAFQQISSKHNHLTLVLVNGKTQI